MTHDNRSHLDRRTVLKSSGIALAGLGGLTSTVAARGNGNEGKRVSLLEGPAEFQLFWSGVDGDPSEANELTDFGYPTDPADIPFDGKGSNGAFFATEDPIGGLFNASQIEMTPNGQTLHHTFRPLGGNMLKRGRGKPYTLVNRGLVPGAPLYAFEAKGQLLNFEAKDENELAGIISMISSLGGDPMPITKLAGGRWRAVGSEVIYVRDINGQPSRQAPYSVTRVDFYDRSSKPMNFALSILYVIYPNLNGGKNPVPADPMGPTMEAIPLPPYATGDQFIQQGPRNQGGH